MVLETATTPIPKSPAEQLLLENQHRVAEALATVHEFTDTLEPTQAALQAAQVAIRGLVDTLEPTQAILQGELANAETRQVALKTKLDTDLPTLHEEKTDVGHPLVLGTTDVYVYKNTPEAAFRFAGGYFKRISGTWLDGEEVVVTVERSLDDIRWTEIWSDKYISDTGQHSPEAVPAFYCNGGGLRVGIKQKVEGAGFHTWSYNMLSLEQSE